MPDDFIEKMFKVLSWDFADGTQLAHAETVDGVDGHMPQTRVG